MGLGRQVRSVQHVRIRTHDTQAGGLCDMTAGTPFSRRWSGGLSFPGSPFGTEALSAFTIRKPLSRAEMCALPATRHRVVAVASSSSTGDHSMSTSSHAPARRRSDTPARLSMLSASGVRGELA